MACTLRQPCGNNLRFIIKRPDGLELWECLNSHSYLLGTPEREPARGRFAYLNTREDARTAPTAAPPPYRRAKTGCRWCGRSRHGQCRRHGGLDSRVSGRLRAAASVCPACKTSPTGRCLTHRYTYFKCPYCRRSKAHRCIRHPGKAKAKHGQEAKRQLLGESTSI